MSGKQDKKLRRFVRRELRRHGYGVDRVEDYYRQRIEERIRAKPRLVPAWAWRRLIAWVLGVG